MAALGAVTMNFAPFAALAYIPERDDASLYGQNDQLEWHWGAMNPEMIEAINDSIAGTVLDELRAARPDLPIVGEAWDRVCADLLDRGIAAIEEAMGSRATPPAAEPAPLPPDVDAGTPAIAGP